jgi:ribosomal protein S18 acetylase RimI-like enzyme
MNRSLRTPVAADYAILASWIPNATACAHWAGPKLQFPFVARELPELLREAQSRSYCMVTSDDSLLGFGQFWPRNERTVHLGRIIVSPLERSHGLGRILLDLLIEEAIQAVRPEVITLRVYRDNSAALSLYANRGFVAVDAESNAEVLTMELKAAKSPPPTATARSVFPVT